MQRLSKLRLETPRLLIRPIDESDLDDVFSLHSDSRVNQFIPYKTWQNRKDADTWFDYVQERRDREFAEHFALVLRDTDKLIGSCIAFDFQETKTPVPGRELELGYVLGTEYWRKGFMREALSAFVPALHSSLDLTQLTAFVEEENTGSLMLLESLAFQQVAVERSDDDKPLLKLVRKFDPRA